MVLVSAVEILDEVTSFADPDSSVVHIKRLDLNIDSLCEK